MIKFNDKVRVIKDDDNEGFYIGAEGNVVDRMKHEDGSVSYGIIVDGRPFYSLKEDQLEKI